MEIILASGSPRRKDIFERLKVPFKVVTDEVDETLDLRKTPMETVMELSRRKGARISKDNPQSLVVSADTVVYHSGKILGKPADKEHARKIITALSGDCQEVYSGICISFQGKTAVGYERTKVFFRRLSENEIERYISTAEPYDKAGAYGIQDSGGAFVEKIEGDYFNVVGFPLTKFIFMLKKDFGIDFWTLQR